MNRDDERAIILLALDYDLPLLLKRCAEDDKINRYACKNNAFWRIYMQDHYRALKPIEGREDEKYYYDSIIDQKMRQPYLLPTNPQARTIASRMGIVDQRWQIFAEANIVSGNRNEFDNFCNKFYAYCADDQFWITMIQIFFSHIKGQPEQYKRQYYADKSWKQFYFEIKQNPAILEHGFY